MQKRRSRHVSRLFLLRLLLTCALGAIALAALLAAHVFPSSKIQLPRVLRLTNYIFSSLVFACLVQPRTWSLLKSVELLKLSSFTFSLYAISLFLFFIYFLIIFLDPEMNLNPLFLFWGDLSCLTFLVFFYWHFLKIFGFCCLIHKQQLQYDIGYQRWSGEQSWMWEFSPPSLSKISLQSRKVIHCGFSNSHH